MSSAETSPATIDTPVTILLRFATGLLALQTEVLGTNLAFEHHGQAVEIRIPPESSKHVNNDGGTHGSLRFRQVEQIEIAFYPPDVVTVPRYSPERQRSLTHGQLFQPLRAIAERYVDVANSAFRRFAHVLRWKTMLPAILRPDLEAPQSGWNGSVHQRDDESVLVGTGSQQISMLRSWVYLDPWREAEAALKRGESSPVNIDLLLDAELHLLYGEVRRCLLDLASACEIYMGYKLDEALPVGVNDAVREHLRRTNVSTVRNKLFPSLLTNGKNNPNWKSMKKTLEALFDARNEAIHAGTKHPATKDDCEKFVEAAKKLLTIS